MPIRLDPHDDLAIGVTPGTNKARALRFLYAKPELAFTPKEIADRTAVKHDSIYTVLGRLQEEGLVGRTAHGYYHALKDNDEAVRIARRLRSPGESTEPASGSTEGDAVGGGDPDRDSTVEFVPDEPDGTATLSPDEAFSLLGNETRVGILRALWAAFESGMNDSAVPFSELFDRVEIRDSGNFSYHLEKLTGPYVRRTAEGYELKQTGINVVRSVIVGTVIDDPAFGETLTEVPCPLCNSPVEIAYDDEFMNVSCTSCEGRSRWNDKSGHLFGAFVPPVSVKGRPVEDAFRSAVVYTLHEVAAFHDGVCPDCSSPVETTVSVCSEHQLDRGLRCSNCDRFNMAIVRLVCSTCKRSIPPPATLIILDDPVVTGFYHEHGVEHRFTSWETVVRSYRVDEELLAEDPPKMRFTVPAGDEHLQLTLDGELNVISVSP